LMFLFLHENHELVDVHAHIVPAPRCVIDGPRSLFFTVQFIGKSVDSRIMIQDGVVRVRPGRQRAPRCSDQRLLDGDVLVRLLVIA
jgi:hypothetical protein